MNGVPIPRERLRSLLLDIASKRKLIEQVAETDFGVTGLRRYEEALKRRAPSDDARQALVEFWTETAKENLSALDEARWIKGRRLPAGAYRSGFLDAVYGPGDTVSASTRKFLMNPEPDDIEARQLRYDAMREVAEGRQQEIESAGISKALTGTDASTRVLRPSKGMLKVAFDLTERLLADRCADAGQRAVCALKVGEVNETGVCVLAAAESDRAFEVGGLNFHLLLVPGGVRVPKSYTQSEDRRYLIVYLPHLFPGFPAAYGDFRGRFDQLALAVRAGVCLSWVVARHLATLNGS
jgi:hypothetical protein